MASSSNPRFPIHRAPLHASVFPDRVTSESEEDDDEEDRGSSITSHATSPEKLDVVSTSSSFVFDGRAHASSNASSPTDCTSRDEAGNRYLGTGSAVGGGTTIVEEQIETIITTEGVDDVLHPSDGSVSSHSHCLSQRRNILFADETETLNVHLDLDRPAIRVPFPELGLDLLDIHLSSLLPEETRSSEIRLTDLKSWDENWLFRRQKKKANSVSSYFAFADLYGLDFASEPVRMFIPNPSHEAKTSIGQREVDDLSDDQSEKNSAATSLSFSSDSESESEPTESTDITHQSAMTQASLLQPQKSPSHKNAILVHGPKAQDTERRSTSSQTPDSPRESCRSQAGKSCLESPVPASSGARSQRTSVKISAGKDSCFPVNVIQEERHDPSVGEISLPSFLPISSRVMASSRSDPCFVIRPCGASVQTDILVQFCCRVKGSRPLGVAWFKGDHLLTDDNCFRIFSSGNEFVLEIRMTQMSHSDVYSCVVYNGFGEQWSDFNLAVRERTRSPVTTKATRSTVS